MTDHRRLPPPDAFRPVYCQNPKCDNGRPIGRTVPSAGGIAEFACKVCKIRRVVVGSRGQSA
jgi:hypothetical protein